MKKATLLVSALAAALFVSQAPSMAMAADKAPAQTVTATTDDQSNLHTVKMTFINKNTGIVVYPNAVTLLNVNTGALTTHNDLTYKGNQAIVRDVADGTYMFFVYVEGQTYSIASSNQFTMQGEDMFVPVLLVPYQG
ncbi:hypothetical protein JJB07_18445 [Tumebacillus sp. ITR2]|uniref:NEAT domain-containing protein n=1 Tax=Tumebacillus amylolyticus TaxID=2801339 RepID=A0ABS1JG79_9BACL|nr:hypothetical protein [Tumebacillus amylolyticus]MBL0388588.1 hypothetical protein [Tumebacillus amylolyticus]